MSDVQRRARLVAPYWTTILGLLLAPVVGSAVGLYVYTAITTLLAGDLTGPLGSAAGILFLGGWFGALMGIIPAFVFGWPLHVVLLRTGKTHLLAYVGLGTVLALLAFVVVYVLYDFGGYWLDTVLELGPAIALAGAIGATTFWFIRRPDRGPEFYSEPAA
jgi:hypothetical protein